MNTGACADGRVADQARGPGLVLNGACFTPVSYPSLAGWASDDHAASFRAFRAGCPAVVKAARSRGSDARAPLRAAVRAGLVKACTAALAMDESPERDLARLFFETHFEPWHVREADGGEGFFTGYYEPEVEGALAPAAGYDVPVLGRPADLVDTPQGVRRKVETSAGARFEPFFDRGQIEDGALAGRGLEIAWLKDPVDLFFMQIQGSARLRLPDGRLLRLNYDGRNGHPYTAVGGPLIARGLVPREEMSMARIRAWMEQNPQEARALRRLNRSYVFFRAVELKADEGPLGAQGIGLAAGRSLAVDGAWHIYGSPVYVEADLPLDRPDDRATFHRLLIAQDTGSAIVGPARGDIYFGAGHDAAEVAGRMRHSGGFTLLMPRDAARELATGREP